MKSAQHLALLCLISGSLPLAIACGSNDSSSLFAPSGGSSATSSGGSLGRGGTSGTSSVGHAGQSSAGSAGTGSSSAGSSGGSGIAGQGMSEGGAGGTGVAGSGTGGMSVAGQAGSPSGGAGGGSTAGSAGIGGGSAGFGGSGAGAGGMSGGSGGGAAGGFAGSSGSAGSGGSGGAGCPADGKPPQDGGVCTAPTPDNCFYSGQACSCVSNGQTTTRHWSCYGTPDKCPTASDTHPADGASCKGFGGGFCPYAPDDFCVCVPAIGGGGVEPKWACSPKSPTCPDTKPGVTPCGINVRECGYSDRECFCGGVGDWACQ